MDKPVKVEWILRKTGVRPFCYLMSHREEMTLEFAYLAAKAFRFSTKQGAQDYARCLYQDYGIVWEPEAIVTEENLNAEKTF